MFVAPQIHGLKPYSPATCWFLRWGCKEVIRIQNIQKWSPPDEMSTFISRGREGETFLALCIREEESGEDTVSRQPQTGQEGGSADPAPAGSLTSHSSLQNLRKHIPAIHERKRKNHLKGSSRIFFRFTLTCPLLWAEFGFKLGLSHLRTLWPEASFSTCLSLSYKISNVQC